MNKNVNSPHKWENYEKMKPGGSLILNSPTHQSSIHSNQPSKHKLEDLLHRQNMIARHASEEEFKRYNYRVNQMAISNINPRIEEDSNNKFPPFANKYTSEIIPSRKGNSKGHDKDNVYFRARNSGGRTGTKDTPELSNTKSEKTLPSFIRNQNRSP
jgi:hypothetical protein